MSLLLALGLGVLSIAPAALQDEQRSEVDLPRGSEQPIHVAPDGSYWIGARHGRLYVSRDRGGSWREVDVPCKKSDPSGGLGAEGDDLGLVRFFDDRVAIVAGRFDGTGGVMRSEDAGASWELRELPGGMNPYDLQTGPDGRAWLVGHTGAILRSDDFGATWTALPSPFSQADRPRSVFFELDGRGLVGGNHNRLELTLDGGVTWTRLPTPLDSTASAEELAKPNGSAMITDSDGKIAWVPAPPGPRAPITKVRLLGGRAILRERSGAHWAGLESRPDWRALSVGDVAVLDFELHPEGLAVIDALGRVSVLSAEGKLLWTSVEAFEGCKRLAFSGGLAVDGSDVLVFDGARFFQRFSAGGTPGPSRLLRAPGSGGWNLIAFDRGADGALWGLTASDLCTSSDSGRTWTRVAELPADLRGRWTHLEVSGGGKLFLWTGGTASTWSRSDGFRPATGLDDPWISGLVKRREAWFLYGMEVAEGANPLCLRATDTIAADESITGIVLASTDGGASWARVHEWPGGGIEDLYVTEGGSLLLFRAGGGIRRGSVANIPPAVSAETVVEPGTAIGIQYGARFAFDDEQHGRLLGGTFFGDPDEEVHYVTEDGGRTWAPVPADPDWSLDERYRLGSGVRALVRRSPGWSFEPPSGLPDTVFVLVGGVPVRPKEFGDIRYVRVDATGGLLVEAADGSLWRLDAEGRAWSLLRPPH